MDADQTGRGDIVSGMAPVWTRSALWFNILGKRNWVASVMRWSRAFGFIVAALPCAAFAGSPACAPDIIGSWTGRVLDGGRIKELRTEFATGSGQLTGRYHVEDVDGGYDGTLTDFTPLGPCAGEFLGTTAMGPAKCELSSSRIVAGSTVCGAMTNLCRTIFLPAGVRERCHRADPRGMAFEPRFGQMRDHAKAITNGAYDGPVPTLASMHSQIG